MDQKIVQTLKTLGFTEYEAKAYVALAGLGMATAREVHEVSGVPQGRIYAVLRGLAENGYLEIQEGSPTYYHAEDPVEVINSLRDLFCKSVDESVQELRSLRYDTRPPSPFWSVHSEWGIKNRVQSLVRNARESVIIMAVNPEALRAFLPDLKKARKKVSLNIISNDKADFAGMNLRVHEPDEALLEFFMEMEMHRPAHVPEGKVDFFMLVDGREAVCVGYPDGKRTATVMRMPALCFMFEKLLRMLDPEI